MCQLMGMSANVPTDACFSFTGLIERGGGTDIHRDGWGIVFYRGRGIQDFRDPNPGVESEVAQLIKLQSIKSKTVISHIRQANVGGISLENTHPFIREMWGDYWVFAHNGQLKGIKKKLKLGRFLPVGSTDSEFVFCWMLEQIRKKFPERPKKPRELMVFIEQLAAGLHREGVFNFLLSDSRYLYAHCSTKLCWITRKAPFGKAQLKDVAMTVDFAKETTPNDIVTVIATEPLTINEQWTHLVPGDFIVFRDGKVRYG